ncbi:MAG: toprim domain-containing protein [Undibacterium sp.]|nr:toprim domain-containing protein [Undibacterium sp.]
MARIPDEELQRLKTEVSLVRLIELAGIKLKKQGKDYAANCPFHDDSTASFIVTESKNLFHCFGCNEAGGPVDWLMKFFKLSFRAAVERLRKEAGSGMISAEVSSLESDVKAKVKGKLKAATALPMASHASDQDDLKLVLGYYHDTLKESPEALDYLQSRGLNHPQLITQFQLGYANRSLGNHLPRKAWKEGLEMRSRLQNIGLLRDSGHEHFSGSLVVPVMDVHGVVHEVYGRKVLRNLRVGTALHLYLPGEHRGVWNEAGLMAANGEVILCEALIDAMTFWVNGFKNVTASYGTNGFTEDHLAAFTQYQIKRVLIAYDRDEAGNNAADALAEKLQEHGIVCYRIQFPKGMDANEYAQKVQPADKALGLLVRKAEWMERQVSEVRDQESVSAATPDAMPFPLAAISSVQLSKKSEQKAAPIITPTLPEVIPEPTINSPLPPASQEDTPTEITDTDLTLTYGTRRYRIRGWKKPTNPESLKVNILVSKEERFHVDSFDLYQAKARAAFIKCAGLELGEAEDTLKHDLGRVLLKLEELQSSHLQAALKKEDDAPKLTDIEQRDALDLLQSPQLLERILSDFDACGVVGEETNKLVGYLAAVSRQLDKPLAVLIQSSSAAGKSSLMDAVLAFMPDEAQVRYSAMTGQSLFYMGETSLKHKILAIAEEEGAAQASYALKLLQSDGQVSMASTGKDATTGLLTTHEYKVEGPVMLFLTTTAIDIDEELLNRCVLLTVNESREQTKAIHVLQRQRQTLQGLLQDEGRDAILNLHRNAQRLLQPFKVVNPYADQLTFLDDKTRTRRDHMKYLSLIRAITFLHQYQREIKTVQHRGQTVRYIEVTPQDIAIANRLAHEVLGRTLDELPPQTRKLLITLHAWVKSESAQQSIEQKDFRFTRRQVRDLTGWGNTQLFIHMQRLAEMEYLYEHGGRRGQTQHYELAYSGEGDHGQAFVLGLLDSATLNDEGSSVKKEEESTTTTAAIRGKEGEYSGSIRGQFAPNSGAIRGGEITPQATTGAAFDDFTEKNPKTHVTGVSEIEVKIPVVDRRKPSKSNGIAHSAHILMTSAHEAANDPR